MDENLNCLDVTLQEKLIPNKVSCLLTHDESWISEEQIFMNDRTHSPSTLVPLSVRDGSSLRDYLSSLNTEHEHKPKEVDTFNDINIHSSAWEDKYLSSSKDRRSKLGIPDIIGLSPLMMLTRNYEVASKSLHLLSLSRDTPLLPHADLRSSKLQKGDSESTKPWSSTLYGENQVSGKCSKDLVSKKAGQEHAINHENLKTFECKFCSKQLMSKQTLKRHYLVHSGVKDFKCITCEKDFRTKHELKEHSSIHIREKTETCRVCGRGFKRKKYLTRHMYSAHGTGSYVCKVCDKRFGYKSLLKRHLATHSDIRVTCVQCGKSCKNEATLVTHQRQFCKAHA